MEPIEEALQLARSQKLLGGDLRALIGALARTQTHNERHIFAYDRVQLMETARTTLDAIGQLLADAQRDSWLDVAVRERITIAASTIGVVKTTLRNVARSTPNADIEMFESSPLVVGGAVVTRGGERAVDLPIASSSNNDDNNNNNSVDRVSIELSSTSTTTSADQLELVFASIANIGNLLHHHDVANVSPSSARCRRVVRSRVVSVHIASRTLQSADFSTVPLIITFFRPSSTTPRLENDHDKASSRIVADDVRCERWQSSTRSFTNVNNEAETCELLAHNSTHTTCRCIGVGDFAVVTSSCPTTVSVEL